MKNNFTQKFLMIKKEVEEFTALIDQNIGVQIGEHSCAYIDNNDIVIGVYSTLYRDNVVDIAHEDYYLTNGFNYEDYGIHYETFVILHEIGHLQTVPTKREQRKYNRQERKITKNKKLTDYEKLMHYVRLDVEVNADKWAMNYIKKFPILVQDLDNIIHIIKSHILEEMERLKK